MTGGDERFDVIVIDDEEDIREVLRMTLEDAGYRVRTAADGEQGLALCRQSLPQIVVTDIRMPGIDGLQVLEIIKKKWPDVEVIVATAFADMDLAIGALQLEASDFITKPINDEALHQALRRARQRYRTAKQLRDYTQQQMADQARILHQDKMMSLGRLAASMVHEINNPLAGILNYLRLMGRILKRGPLSENDRRKFTRYLDLVETETVRCSQIVSNLLTFSRKSESVFSSVEVRNLIDRCVLLSRHKLELSSIEIQVQIPDSLPEVHGDFNHLQQCLINLILNAVDVMPLGGRVTIGAVHHTGEQVVEVFVEDTGPGIAEEDLPHLFEPFFTTKNEGYGVGLGLSTVYGIMEAHHGTVEVTSRPGKGACFRLKFPSRPVPHRPAA